MKKILIIILMFLLQGCQTDNTNIVETPVIKETEILVEHQIEVPVLMYHHIDESVNGNGAIVSPKKFESDLEIIQNLGYETIDFRALIDYVMKSEQLPDKPIIITFDDGYSSNYTYAFPLLKEKNMKATISIIGWSVGEKTYKTLDHPIIPHFTLEEGRVMQSSGVIDIQSHSFSMHDSPSLETGFYRDSALPKEDEEASVYLTAMQEDLQVMENIIENDMQGEFLVFTYPLGFYNTLSEQALDHFEIPVSITVEHGINSIVQGDVKTLRLLKRYNVTETVDLNTLLLKQK